MLTPETTTAPVAEATTSAPADEAIRLARVAVEKFNLTQSNVTEAKAARFNAAREAAKAMAHAIKSGATQMQVAEGVNKSQPWVSRMLKWHKRGLSDNDGMGKAWHWNNVPFGNRATERAHSAGPFAEQSKAARERAKENYAPTNKKSKAHEFDDAIKIAQAKGLKITEGAVGNVGTEIFIPKPTAPTLDEALTALASFAPAPTPKSFKIMASGQLGEFCYVVDHRLPKMTDNELKKAVAYVTATADTLIAARKRKATP